MAMFSRLCWCALILTTIGCGEKLPTTVSVTGTVTYQSNPVEGAQVVLNNVDPKGKPAAGVTDASGKFTVKTYVSPSAQASGALPGKYEVTVTKIEKSTMSSEEMMKASAGKQQVAGTKHLIPERYSNPKKSEIVVDVASGLAPLTLDLKD